MNDQKSSAGAANIILALAAVTSVAALGTALGQDVLIDRYIEGAFSALGIFMIANPVAKLSILLAFLVGAMNCLLAILALVLGRKAQPKGAFTPLDIITLCGAFVLIGIGLLSCAYSEAMIQMAVQAVGSVSLAITAPHRVEQLFTLGTALWPAAFSLVMVAASMRLRLRAKAH